MKLTPAPPRPISKVWVFALFDVAPNEPEGLLVWKAENIKNRQCKSRNVQKMHVFTYLVQQLKHQHSVIQMVHYCGCANSIAPWIVNYRSCFEERIVDHMDFVADKMRLILQSLDPIDEPIAHEHLLIGRCEAMK